MYRVKGGFVSRRALEAALCSAYNLDIHVSLLDSDGKFIQNLTRNFYEGSVSIDSSADVTRALDMVLFDPDHNAAIEPTSPGRTSIFIADMLHVEYVVSTPDRQQVWEIPVFTGPIDQVDRDDIFVNIKALGKEALSTSNGWRAKVYKKGQGKTDVIKDILRDLLGETRMVIPDRKAQLPNDFKVHADEHPWKAARRLARSMGYQLYYNGDGLPKMRKRMKTPLFKFTEHWVIEFPKVSYDLNETINAVRVIGGKPKKSKRKVKYTAVAKRKHPLSPWRLGRGGRKRFLWLVIEDESIDSKGEARAVAKRELRRGLLAGVAPSWSGITHPCLEELDMVRIDIDGFHSKFPMSQWTIPLIAGDSSSYGYLRRVKPKGGPRGIRRSKKGKGKGKKLRSEIIQGGKGRRQ